jgi:hypothetical protein
LVLQSKITIAQKNAADTHPDLALEIAYDRFVSHERDTTFPRDQKKSDTLIFLSFDIET